MQFATAYFQKTESSVTDSGRKDVWMVSQQFESTTRRNKEDKKGLGFKMVRFKIKQMIIR